MAVGLVVDYMVHIVHYFLHQVLNTLYDDVAGHMYTIKYCSHAGVRKAHPTATRRGAYDVYRQLETDVISYNNRLFSLRRLPRKILMAKNIRFQSVSKCKYHVSCYYLVAPT